MLPWQWILMAAVAAALVILGVLVLAAVAASRSRIFPPGSSLFLSVCNEAHSMLGCFLRQTGCGESCRPMESTPAQWESRAKERRRLGRAPASSCATA